VEPAENNGTTSMGTESTELFSVSASCMDAEVIYLMRTLPSALVAHVATPRVWCGCGNFLSVGSIDARKVKRGQAGLAGL
jgi:hypothetical protein